MLLDAYLCACLTANSQRRSIKSDDDGNDNSNHDNENDRDDSYS